MPDWTDCLLLFFYKSFYFSKMIMCALTLIQYKTRARRSRLLTIVLINIFIKLIYIKVISFTSREKKWFREWLANCNRHNNINQVYSSTFKQSQMKTYVVSQKSMYYETWNCIMFKVFCIRYVLVKWKGTSVLYLLRWLFYSLDDGNLFIDFWTPDWLEDIRYLADVKTVGPCIWISFFVAV